MHYVYFLESLSQPGERYIGLASDLKSRLIDHNARKSPHTAKFKPWRLATCVAFVERRQAAEFEA